jgi:hypothetical protein
MPAIKLAREIRRAYARLDALWQEVRSDEKRARIEEQMDALDRETMRLISINVKKSGREYEAATRALASANRKLRKAIDDLQKLAEAVEAVAAAVDAVAGVIPV